MARSTKIHRIIETDDDVLAGVRSLRRKCAIIRRAHDLAGNPPLRRRESGFEGLARIIIGQQVSVASAAAIWGRFELALRPLDAHAVAVHGFAHVHRRQLHMGAAAADDLQPRVFPVHALDAHAVAVASETVLRAAGLSGPKIRTLRNVSAAVVSGGLDLVALDAAPDQVVHDALRSVSGIGPWTADIYLLFCLGRADAFAAGDLALQIAAAMAAEQGDRLTVGELEEMSERWRPWRGVAARLLWAYYAAAKAQKSAVPV